MTFRYYLRASSRRRFRWLVAQPFIDRNRCLLGAQQEPHQESRDDEDDRDDERGQLEGIYVEPADFADADDLYGRSKYLGEVKGENAVTLRTSIIGHELQGKLSLVEWFLSQNGSVNGYVNAIYSGFPTIELARIIDEYVIPDAGLSGLYHVSSEPVSKYELLRMIAEIYNKKIDILPYDKFTENKSLDSTRFRERTGYVPPDWRTLVEKMHKWYQRNISMYK